MIHRNVRWRRLSFTEISIWVAHELLYLLVEFGPLLLRHIVEDILRPLHGLLIISRKGKRPRIKSYRGWLMKF